MAPNRSHYTFQDCNPQISFSHFKIMMQQMNRTQSELFKMYPGIYYNPVCRSYCDEKNERTIYRERSIKSKAKLFNELYELEADKYFEKTAAKRNRFKKGVEIEHANALSKFMSKPKSSSRSRSKTKSKFKFMSKFMSKTKSKRNL